MNYTLRYSSLRSEVWRWYWKAWKVQLWRIHASIAAFLCIAFVGTGHKSTVPVMYAEYFFIALLILTTISSLFPQLLFKSRERILNVGPAGWETQIGKKKGARSWSEIASIKEDSGNVVITNKKGNALIVPGRAFENSEERERFYSDIRGWHASSTSACN